MTCGIYKIINTNTGKVYVGSSVNIERRTRIHFWKLGNNKHDNQYLQNSFNKHGKDKFNIEVLEKCSVQKLHEREQFWIDSFDFENELYNLCKVAYSTLGRLATEETRKKMSINNGRYWLGKKRRKETMEKVSKSLMDRGKPVKQIDKKTNKLIAVFPSVQTAARHLGVDGGTISKCARKNGINKSAYGFLWEYVNEQL